MSRSKDAGASRTMQEGEPELTAHYLWGPTPPQCAPVRRDWMDETAERFAYRCLPMVIANQAGWFVLHDHPVELRWDGRDAADGVQVRHLDERHPSRMVSSQFGHGIVTWTIPYLFRTSPGYNLLVRGPANWPRDGVQALEGIVETDWTEATFTMSWKLTRPDHWVRFDAGDPICMIVPQRRGELESFRTRLRPLAGTPELEAAYTRWVKSRRRFLVVSNLQGADDTRMPWQKHYFRGMSAEGNQPHEDHQVGLDLRPFTLEPKDEDAAD